jgi:peptidoglycan biosynthesis protein MviN/MurJ (putative lipid II flippase)
LLWLLHRKTGIRFTGDFGPVLVKTAVGTALMAAAGWVSLAVLGGLAHDTGGDVTRILILVGVCGGVYAAAAYAMKNPMLALVVRSRRKKGPAETAPSAEK